MGDFLRTPGVERHGRLDCETPQSALESYCSILEASPRDLKRRFAEFDLEATYGDQLLGPPSEEVVYRGVLNREERRFQPLECCWFHATRALPGTAFSKGILPTSQVANDLWQLVRTCDPTPPPETTWTRFRQAVESEQLGHSSSLYGLKLKLPGPFAFLIQEELDHLGQTTSVDYFKSAETIEDICLCYEAYFGRPLLPAVQARTQPCVVKFVARLPERVMDTVALYLYLHQQGRPAFKVNTCFDGKGVAVQPDQVLSITWR